MGSLWFSTALQMEQQHQHPSVADALRALTSAGDHRLAGLPVQLWLLTCDDIALIYSITSARARARCAAGAVPGAFKVEGRWRVRAVDLIASWRDAAQPQLDVGGGDGRLADGWQSVVPRQRGGDA